MSARVLLNLLNELRKSDKMRGMSSIVSLFLNEYNKFNNTGIRMFNSFITWPYNFFEIVFLRENAMFSRRYYGRNQNM